MTHNFINHEARKIVSRTWNVQRYKEGTFLTVDLVYSGLDVAVPLEVKLVSTSQ